MQRDHFLKETHLLLTEITNLSYEKYHYVPSIYRKWEPGQISGSAAIPSLGW